MKTAILFCLLVNFANASDLWVVGKGYLLHHEKGKTHVLKKRAADSSGYDAINCRLWVTENHNLYAFDRRRKTFRGEADKILTDVTTTFLTLGEKGRIERRDQEGKILNSYPSPWQRLPVKAVQTKHFIFALLEEGNKLTLAKYDSDLRLLSQTVLSEGKDFWNTPVLLADESTESLWIGYTVTQPWTIYAPVIEKRNFVGELMMQTAWKERGVLFDACMSGDNTLVSRDIPSNSGYTVPVHSYLEGVNSSKGSETLFSHRENLFIDSLSCQNGKTYFISRSIFGSDGSTVEVWNNKPNEMSKTLFKLPDPAWKIYSCPVQSVF